MVLFPLLLQWAQEAWLIDKLYSQVLRMVEKAVLHKHNQQRQQNSQEVLWFQWKQYYSESRDILLIKYVTIYFIIPNANWNFVNDICHSLCVQHMHFHIQKGKRKTSWVETWKTLIPVRMVLAPYTALHWFGCTLTALVCNARKMWFELSYHIIMPLPWSWLHKWEFMWLNGLFVFI